MINKSIVKKILIVVLVVLVGVGIIGAVKSDNSTDCIRIHIRANSMNEYDKRVKYEVKDELVSLLSPLLIECNSKAEAYSVVKNNLDNIHNLAQQVLIKNGLNYSVRVMLRKEEFPTRQYLNYTLPSGIYDSLTIELGEAVGDNWWCVAFPPLCFSEDTDDYYYKSRLQELIDKFL